MKERPILFTPGNVRAILNGTKTQTRRIVKPQPISISWFEHQEGWCARVREDMGSAKNPAFVMVPCPYGVPGDQFWVRETWRVVGGREYEYQQRIEDVKYKANLLDVIESGNAQWRPSIFMPKWACRLRLEIAEVRVQRLQEISQTDAIAEGAPPSHPSIDSVSQDFGYTDFSRSWYAQLWESINGAGSWDANPWVWAITFKQVKG